jgi:hypothetical protein
MKSFIAPLCFPLLLAIPLAIPLTTALAIPLATAQTPSPNLTIAPKRRLTPDQTSQIDQIRQTSRQRIQALFSDEQRQRYASLRQRGISAAQGIEMIDLSRTDRATLRQILQETRTALTQVLGQTPKN